jgi:chemotaxis protein CheD
MGELAAAAGEDDVLVTVGLGSCIGLALLDRAGGIAGLAHVVLPEGAGDAPAQPGKFAETAVPALLGMLADLGARRFRLEAALVGGAQMFSFGGLEIGARNEAAVRSALESERIPVRAALTGGSTGRTMKVTPVGGVVMVREAGSADRPLVGTPR